MKYLKTYLPILVIIFLSTCRLEKKNFFPTKLNQKWTYSIVIHSSYKDEKYLKRVMITNVKSKSMNDNKIELSKLYSDGSYYTYEIDKNQNTLLRKSVVLAFKEGIVEPVQKIVYPDLSFEKKKWVVQEQLFLVRGFQPPLRNFKPRSQFKMTYKVTRENFKYRLKNQFFSNCIEIEGIGKADFIADTRSGPIQVDIKNTEILCNNIGLVYQNRSEITNASAFGNMELKKTLINSGD